MILHDNSYRNRAANALHSLVGGPARGRLTGPVPAAIEMPGVGLVITAGDSERALAPSALRPLSASTGWSVLATWVDQMLTGHTFLLDAVVMTAGRPRVFVERVLFRTPTGETFLVGQAGRDPAVVVDAGGIRVALRQPYRTEPERMLGIAAGQALLQERIYAGTPFATPLPRNLGR